MQARDKRTLVVVNPGHFHAALTMRQRHPLLSDEVYVYAEDGPDLRAFLNLVNAFNRRQQAATSWGLHIYLGADYLDALLQSPPGDVAIVAGRNDTKLSTMCRLHQAGLYVLGDKTWLIDSSHLDLLEALTTGAPLAMDIMTERFEIATRLQQALSCEADVFGGFRTQSAEPAVYIRSVHHLYKEVNGQPLVRPAWYFDTSIQGEGITDVTAHLVDLAQWMVAGDSGADVARDIVLTGARQWPTEIPFDLFRKITGLESFPAAVAGQVSGNALHYPCNANICYMLRGVPVELDSIWNLAIPPGGGDTHYGILRGERADLIVEQGPDTGFLTRLRVEPASNDAQFRLALQRALAGLNDICPGIGLRAEAGGFLVEIPDALHQGHEARFAQVLDQFLGYVAAGTWPQRISGELVAKYTLLANAHAMSHRSG